MIQEGSARIEIETPKIVSKKMEVFYNPVMELNRTISILLIKSYFKKPPRIADIMAGSGVRAIRLLKEAKINSIAINDYSEQAIKRIKKNLRLNEINENYTLHNKDANIFLLESKGFDYIDVDPFGSPNPYLDAAIKRISRDGILAVTATDTAALTGTYENACKRKYWAVPLRNYMMHEIAVRILIRKVQLIGAQYEKALTPVISYSKDHYYRILLKCEKGKRKCDEIIKKHCFFNFCHECGSFGLEECECEFGRRKKGPIWTGTLNDTKILGNMLKMSDEKTKKFLDILKEESKIGQVGFYSLNKMAKGNIPKIKELLEKLESNKIKAARTHFSHDGIKASKEFSRFL